MKKNVKDTSIDAYYNLKDLSEKRREVMRAIITLNEHADGCCDVDIAKFLGWPINRVTGRRWELESAGKVESVGKKLSKHSDIAVYHWKAVKQ